MFYSWLLAVQTFMRSSSSSSHSRWRSFSICLLESSRRSVEEKSKEPSPYSFTSITKERIISM